jgi:hypothetical protein
MSSGSDEFHDRPEIKVEFQERLMAGVDELKDRLVTRVEPLGDRSVSRVDEL